jgi:ankyrin repeat protein
LQILEMGADPNASFASSGTSPLMLAAAANDTALIEALFKRGAKTDVVDNDACGPVHYAARAGSLETLQVLLDKGLRKDGRNVYGQTPSALALSLGQKSAADFISKWVPPQKRK